MQHTSKKQGSKKGAFGCQNDKTGKHEQEQQGIPIQPLAPHIKVALWAMRPDQCQVSNRS